MLTLFARIRGLRSTNNLINNEIEKLANFVDLTQYLDRPCGQYSGGNKRKLNVALALIGRPKVMLLDEPTTGVDPAARRKIWETINNIRKSGTSIILTSHSMDECGNRLVKPPVSLLLAVATNLQGLWPLFGLSQSQVVWVQTLSQVQTQLT